MKKLLLRSLFAASLTGAFLLPTTDADAALNAYLKLKGQKQGEIKGSVVQKGKEGRIRVLAFNHSIMSPRDAASGLPTGKRQHKPFVITKELDKSSPRFLNAIYTNETLTSVLIGLLLPNGETMATVHLENAHVSEDVQHGHTEEISFVYQKITWTWTDGGITAVDDWQADNT